MDEVRGDSPQTVDPLDATLDRPDTSKTTGELIEELMTLNAELEARGIRIYNSVPWEVIAPLMAASAVFSKTFLETLGKHAADGLVGLVRTRIRKNGGIREALVGPEDGSAAVLVITGETPDEARLALLDLDVTAEEVRGKLLRWDADAMIWRPGSAKE